MKPIHHASSGLRLVLSLLLLLSLFPAPPALDPAIALQIFSFKAHAPNAYLEQEAVHEQIGESDRSKLVEWLKIQKDRDAADRMKAADVRPVLKPTASSPPPAPPESIPLACILSRRFPPPDPDSHSLRLPG